MDVAVTAAHGVVLMATPGAVAIVAALTVDHAAVVAVGLITPPDAAMCMAAEDAGRNQQWQ